MRNDRRPQYPTMTRSPIDQLIDYYNKDPGIRTFPQDLYLHLRHGYVISTPGLFVMGRPILVDYTHEQLCDISLIPEHPDCWLVWAAAGAHPRDILRQMPYYLPYVGWQRRNKFRFYLTTQLHG